MQMTHVLPALMGLAGESVRHTVDKQKQCVLEDWLGYASSVEPAWAP